MILINNILSRIKNELEVSTCYAKPTLQTVKWLTELYCFYSFCTSFRLHWPGCIPHAEDDLKLCCHLPPELN